MMVLAFIGGVFFGSCCSFFCLALCIGAHNSNYHVEEYHKKEESNVVMEEKE